MNAHITGKLIAQKRREKNLTQEQLGELLHVSNKTVSKWETGRCMPDYTLVGRLCRELDITPAQLLTGEEQADGPGEAQLLELLRRTQALEKQRTGLFGLVQVARHRPYGRIGGVLHRADGNRRDGTSGSQ